MKTRECIVICVGIVGLVALLVSVILIDKVSDRLEQFTEAISQPAVTSEVVIERLTITNLEGVSLELTGLEAEINSRLLDLFLNAMAEAEIR